MPHVPPGVAANILSNFSSELVSWMDGAEVPAHDPDTNVMARYGCTINKDFSIEATRSHFKRGLQESWQNDVWVKNLWVPASNVDKGERWRSDIKGWHFTMDLSGWQLPSRESKVTFRDTTVFGKTVTRLIDEFHANPAPFMGTKIQDLLDKMTIQKQDCRIESIAGTIVQGIRNANLYTTLDRESFTITDVIDAARYRISQNCPRGKGGVYLRYHASTSEVTHRQPNTKYVYVGKTMNFKDRFDSHSSSTSSYGDLTRNSSQLLFLALCTMTEADTVDFGYLVEQIFVCLFETYRSDLLVNLSGAVDAVGGMEHAEAVQAAHYFRGVAQKVFSETHFPGAICRSSFGVPCGANYSTPIKE